MVLFNGLLRRMNQYVTGICMIMISSLVLILFIQVIFRYAFNNALGWPDELSRFLLIWITFLGASVATWYRGHLMIDFFIKKIPKKLESYVTLALYLITCVFLLTAVIASFKSINVSFGMSLVSLPLSWGHAFISFPIGLGLSFLYYLNFMFNKRVD